MNSILTSLLNYVLNINDQNFPGVKLNVPSGLWKKSQLTKDEIVHSKKILKVSI